MNTNTHGTPDPIDPRFTDNPTTTRGTPRRRSPPASPEQQEQRVEEARTLLRLNFPGSDIRRMLSKKWGISRKHVNNYLSRAKKRNKSMFELSEDESLACSVNFWAGKQQDAEQTIHRERAMLARANETIERCDSEVSEIEARKTPENPELERLEILELRKKNAIAIREQARRAIYSATQASLDTQREIDRLKGNHAPLKVARTTKDGRDIVPEELSEPTTQGGVDAELKELVEKLKARNTAAAGQQGQN